MSQMAHTLPVGLNQLEAEFLCLWPLCACASVFMQT